MKNDNNKNKDNANLDYLHGACIIDENGQEILITEKMIQDACEKLSSDDTSDSGNQSDQSQSDD